MNSVAADGAAERPADLLILAPAPLDFAAEDLPRARLEDAPATPVETAQSDTAAAEVDVTELADTLAEDVTPLSGTLVPPQVTSDAIPSSIKGVARSPLPRPRPIGDAAAEAVARSVVLASAPAGASLDVDADSLPVGTRLVQFGAFDTPEEAKLAWDKLDTRFTDFLAEKQRVIQKAVSGGKTFYRLRAVGFADINDARRFCSALLAERQACIPVVTR